MEPGPFMAESEDKCVNAISGLIDIIRKLRGPGGCSWDRKQTVESLCPYLLEEAYEVTDAIHEKDMDLLKAELGDLLLHVFMSAIICEEENKFFLDDVVESVSLKLIRRHPHVFGEKTDLSPEEVERQWETIKASEKKDEGFFGSFPSGMPALQTAWRLQQRASKIGFDWPDADGARNKILEELREFEMTLRNDDSDAQTEELGDMLFSVVNYCRLLGFEPEAILRKNNRKFIDRFTLMEKILSDAGCSLEEADIGMMESAWQKAKE